MPVPGNFRISGNSSVRLISRQCGDRRVNAQRLAGIPPLRGDRPVDWWLAQVRFARIVEDGAPSDLIGGSGAFADLHQAWLDSLV